VVVVVVVVVVGCMHEYMGKGSMVCACQEGTSV